MLTWLFTGLLVIPKVASYVLCLLHLDMLCPFDILPIDSYVTFMSILWIGYNAANVTAKHRAFNEVSVGNTSSSSSTTTTTETSSDNNGDNEKPPEVK